MRDNLRDILNLELENIHVTEELKSRTLEACKNADVTSSSNKKIISKRILATAASLMLITLSGISYHNFLYKPSIPQVEIGMNNSGSKDAPLQSVQPEKLNPAPSETAKAVPDNQTKEVVQPNNNKPKDIAVNNPPNLKPQRENPSTVLPENKNNNSNTKTTTENPKTAASAEPVTEKETPKSDADGKNYKNIPSLATGSRLQIHSGDASDNTSDQNSIKAADNSATSPNDKLKAAEKAFGQKLLLPSAVPEGYTMSSVEYSGEDAKNVKITYTSGSNYFEINQAKASNSNDIKNIEKTIAGVTYTIVGNLPESTLKNILNSLK